MTFSATISPESIASFSAAVKSRLEATRQPVQAAMAEQYFQVVQSNFGETGMDRPWEFQPLSDRSAVGRAYIMRVGRTYATLYDTGKMFSTVHMDGTNPEGASVSMEN